MARSEPFDDLATEADDVADDPFVDDVVVDDEMAEAAAQVGEDWFQRTVREAREMEPQLAEEMGWQYPPPGAEAETDIVGDMEAADEFMGAAEEVAAFESAVGYAPEPEIDMQAIEAEVDAVLAERDQPVELTPEQMARGEAVTEQTAVLEWFFKGEGFTRKVDPQQIVSQQFQAAAENAMLRASKKGIVCAELDAISQRRKRFKKDIEPLRLPCDLLRGGQVLVPLANVDTIDALWQEFKADDRENVRRFLVVYRREQARAQQLQGPLYNPRHYPSLEKVAASFVADCRWLALNAPQAMQEIQAVSFRQANAQLRAQVAEAGVEMVANLRSEAAGWVNWLVEQLAVGADGKRKSINEDKFADAQRFFQLAGNLNVAGDAEFAEVIELGKAAIAGQDVAELKKGKGKNAARMSADALRTDIAQKFEAIKNEKMNGWVVDAHAGREIAGLDEV